MSTEISVTNAELDHMLHEFAGHLGCWSVHLGHGSFLGFEFGKHWKEVLPRGDVVEIGSTSLLMEGYDWEIYRGYRRIIDSEHVSDDNVENLQRLFMRQQLLRMDFFGPQKLLTIKFSADLRITSKGQTGRSDGYNDDCLCTLVLPNGKVIACDPIKGFVDDGSQSSVHKAAFEQGL